MPQLDSMTFFSQFFWLSFFFLGFYAILVKYYLPKMSRILKIRSRKIANPQGQAGESHNVTSGNDVRTINENQEIRILRDKLLSTGIKHVLNSFQEKTNFSAQWLNSTIDITNKNQLKAMNTKYLATLADSQVQDIFLFHHLKSVIAPNAFQESGIPLIFKKSIQGGYTQQGVASTSAKEKLFTYRVFENLTR
jgi:hypothetical protein